MNRQAVIAAGIALVVGLLVGGMAVKIQLMDQAVRNQAIRIGQAEATLGQIVQFLNQAQAARTGQGTPPPEGVSPE